MATLYVRDVPDELYERLRKQADARDSSISSEALRLLTRALRSDRVAIRTFLDEVEARPLRVAPGAPSPAELIREDRDAG
jgi:plasmid stability protein